ncbi:MAG: hypothetical protein AB8B53_09375 [Flavobacteriales bacterium]
MNFRNWLLTSGNTNLLLAKALLELNQGKFWSYSTEQAMLASPCLYSTIIVMYPTL